MNTKEIRSLVILVFEQYYREITLNADYSYSPNKIDESALDNFISYLVKSNKNHSINIDSVIEYVELGFHWWHDKKHLRYGTSSIKLSWVIGSSAVKRFENIKDRKYASSYHRRNLRNTVKTNVSTRLKLANMASIRSTQDWLLKAKFEGEEQDKLLFYNKPEGLVYCKAHTTLFNHESKLCSACFNRLRCKEMLKNAMPKIYKIRGYV